jgi:nucleotide-binding universal stress UspA family protein
MTTARVTVGVDGSLIAVRALDRAADEAALRGTGLEIVYAVPDVDTAGPVLSFAAARVHARLPALALTTVPVAGDSAAALAERGRNAVLTVVGSRGLGGITGAVFGSVGVRLAARTRGPLLVVRGSRPPYPYGEVLLATHDDADAAACAFQEADRRHARLHVLPTAPRPRPVAERVMLGGWWPGVLSPAEDLVRQRERREAPARFDAGIHAARFDGVPALLEATRTADVVVIAARQGNGGGFGRSLSPVARALLHRAHCPVLVVPTAARS